MTSMINSIVLSTIDQRLLAKSKKQSTNNLHKEDANDDDVIQKKNNDVERNFANSSLFELEITRTHGCRK